MRKQAISREADDNRSKNTKNQKMKLFAQVVHDTKSKAAWRYSAKMQNVKYGAGAMKSPPPPPPRPLH